jgi:energy-coupling factor transporter ATP-binding protein EcfA2
VIRWRDVRFSYPGGEDGPGAPVLDGVDAEVPEAELVLLAGRTGSGKSTLLRTVNSLVPAFTGGVLTGDVEVGGSSVVGVAPRELAHLVGYVAQDPLAAFVTSSVEEELAYGMEQLGVDPGTMRRRVEETLDLLGIHDLRDRPLRALSGGQQQRVAIGAVLTTHPRVLVLDEPTSALDPTAAEDVLGTLARLVHDLGLTVLVAEHRMERVVPFADRMLVLEAGRLTEGLAADLLRDSVVAPPLVELGRLAGWQPLPLTVREARRRTSVLRERLAEPVRRTAPDGEVVLDAADVVVRYGRTTAVAGVSLQARGGEVVALMGRNGSGKSSLLWALQGARSRAEGRVTVDGRDPAAAPAGEARRLVGLVPQTASDLLYLDTVAGECRAADHQAGVPDGTCAVLLDRLTPGVDLGRHPRDLSEGQRLALVLAVMLTADPAVVALDEPTRGLDYEAKRALGAVLAELAHEGRAVLVATHDVEFAAEVADRVLVLAGGEVVSEGPAATVLAESPAFAPQVTKVLGAPWLTVTEVRRALRPVPVVEP